MVDIYKIESPWCQTWTKCGCLFCEQQEEEKRRQKIEIWESMQLGKSYKGAAKASRVSLIMYKFVFFTLTFTLRLFFFHYYEHILKYSNGTSYILQKFCAKVVFPSSHTLYTPLHFGGKYSTSYLVTLQILHQSSLTCSLLYSAVTSPCFVPLHLSMI